MLPSTRLPLAPVFLTCAALFLLAGCQGGRNDVPPRVVEFALYEDANLDGLLNAGDTLVLTFDQAVTLSGVAATDFELPVASDTLGGSPSFAVGPAPNQLTITLGTSPILNVRQIFAVTDVAAGDPSGIDIAEAIADGSIVGDEDDETAQPGTPVDLIPAFTDSGQVFTTMEGRAVVHGDFDLDGDLDLFVCGDNEPNIVLTNTGGGIFVDSGQTLGSASSVCAAVGDFDLDGDLDVAVGNDTSSANQIWENDGAGVFSAGNTFGTSSCHGLVAGDFDGDGDLDLVLANDSTNTIFFNAAGVFTVGGSTIGTVSSRAIAAADFDQDGDLDLAIANTGAASQIWRNNGSGIFTNIVNLTGPTSSTSIAAGDIDGDGFADVVIGSIDRGLTAFLNVGTFSFTADPDYPSTSTRAVHLADYDADGDLDLFHGRSANFGDRVLLNDGIGFFRNSGMSLGTVSTYGFTTADFDQDGDLDLATATLTGSPLVYQNPLSGATGAFDLVDSGQDLRNNTTPAFNVILDVFLSDLDGDGDVDLVSGATTNGPARAWLNDGTATMIAGANLSIIGTSALAVTAGDVTGDGLPDVFVGRSGTNTLLLRNDGGGLFTSIGAITNSVSATTLRLANVDGDGDLDLITDNGTEVRVFLNDGTGSFTDTAQTLGTVAPTGIAIGDLDGDSDLDLVLGAGTGGMRVLTNDGSGTFTDSAQSLGTSTTNDLALADVDADGDLDIIEAVDGGNAVWTNDGSAVFTDSAQSLGTDDSRRVAVADLDQDGDLDFIEANDGSASRVYLNDGLGVFTDSGVTMVTDGSARDVAVADLDGDGDLDAAFGTSSGGRIYLRD